MSRYGPGAEIVFRSGLPEQAIREVCAAVGAGAVLFNRRYDTGAVAADMRTAEALAGAGAGAGSGGNVDGAEEAKAVADGEGGGNGSGGGGSGTGLQVRSYNATLLR